MDIPPQYGLDSIPRGGGRRREHRPGGDEKLPLGPSNEAARAAAGPRRRGGAPRSGYKLVGNAKNVALRGARRGAPGARPFQAPLADPSAKPNEAAVAPVDACLRHVARALIEGTDAADAAAAADVAGAEGADAVAADLRDRVGVPRDMGQAAAIAARDRVGRADWPRDMGQARANAAQAAAIDATSRGLRAERASVTDGRGKALGVNGGYVVGTAAMLRFLRDRQMYIYSGLITRMAAPLPVGATCSTRSDETCSPTCGCSHGQPGNVDLGLEIAGEHPSCERHDRRTRPDVNKSRRWPDAASGFEVSSRSYSRPTPQQDRADNETARLPAAGSTDQATTGA